MSCESYCAYFLHVNFGLPEWGYTQPCNTVCSRYMRLLIQLNTNKKWPSHPRINDSRPIFPCSRFSDNENTLY